MLCNKYKGSPEICIFIVGSVPPCENFLKIPYKGGYPDLHPVVVAIHNILDTKNETNHYFQTIISLSATGKQLYTYIKTHCQNSGFSLQFAARKVHGAHTSGTDQYIPNDEQTLREVGIKEGNEIVVLREEVEKYTGPSKLFLMNLLELSVFIEDLYDNMPKPGNEMKDVEAVIAPVTVALNSDEEKQFEEHCTRAEVAVRKEKKSFETPSIDELVRSMTALNSELTNKNS